MDKVSFLCATVSSKHLLTAQLEYNLVVLTLNQWDKTICSHSKTSHLKTAAFQSFVHFILSTWFL